MMAIGSYLAFVIFVMGTMSAAFVNDSERNRFYQDMLAAHNRVRGWHNTTQLQLSQRICDEIKVHTDELQTNQNTQIPTQYGINVYSMEFNNWPVLDANAIVSSWYRHGNGYNYLVEPESPSKQIDAFTQLMWNNTTEIGVGMWTQDDICYVVVAYSPKGNIRGQYLTNVLRR